MLLDPALSSHFDFDRAIDVVRGLESRLLGWVDSQPLPTPGIPASRAVLSGYHEASQTLAQVIGVRKTCAQIAVARAEAQNRALNRAEREAQAAKLAADANNAHHRYEAPLEQLLDSLPPFGRYDRVANALNRISALERLENHAHFYFRAYRICYAPHAFAPDGSLYPDARPISRKLAAERYPNVYPLYCFEDTDKYVAAMEAQDQAVLRAGQRPNTPLGAGLKAPAPHLAPGGPHFPDPWLPDPATVPPRPWDLPAKAGNSGVSPDASSSQPGNAGVSPASSASLDDDDFYDDDDDAIERRAYGIDGYDNTGSDDDDDNFDDDDTDFDDDDDNSNDIADADDFTTSTPSTKSTPSTMSTRSIGSIGSIPSTLSPATIGATKLAPLSKFARRSPNAAPSAAPIIDINPASTEIKPCAAPSRSIPASRAIPLDQIETKLIQAELSLNNLTNNHQSIVSVAPMKAAPSEASNTSDKSDPSTQSTASTLSDSSNSSDSSNKSAPPDKPVATKPKSTPLPPMIEPPLPPEPRRINRAPPSREF